MTLLDDLKQQTGHNCLDLTEEDQLVFHWLILADQIEMGVTTIAMHAQAWMPAFRFDEGVRPHPIEGWSYRLKR